MRTEKIRLTHRHAVTDPAGDILFSFLDASWTLQPSRHVLAVACDRLSRENGCLFARTVPLRVRDR